MASAGRRQDRELRSNSSSFGAWLLAQGGAAGLIGMLATAAAADRGFPKTGTVEQVRARLIMAQADGDLFEALDDAELKWSAR